MMKPERRILAVSRPAAMVALETLLGLPEVGVRIVGVNIWGSGAFMDIALDNGEALKFLSVKEMIRPQTILAEVVGRKGGVPKLDQRKAAHAVRLARLLGDHTRGTDEDALSCESGLEFLQQVEVLDFDFTNQADRWAGSSGSTATPGASPASWAARLCAAVSSSATSTAAASCVPTGSADTCARGPRRRRRAPLSPAWSASAGSGAGPRDGSKPGGRSWPGSWSGPSTSSPLLGGRPTCRARTYDRPLGRWDDG
jgi:hypothetical protein